MKYSRPMIRISSLSAIRILRSGNIGATDGTAGARFSDEYILTPEDLTAEAMIDFARYCAATENGMLKEVFRARSG